MTTTNTMTFLVNSDHSNIAKAPAHSRLDCIVASNSWGIGQLTFIDFPGLPGSGIAGTVTPGPANGTITHTIYVSSALFKLLRSYVCPFALTITSDANYAVLTVTCPVVDAARLPAPIQMLLRSTEESVKELVETAFNTPDERVILAAQLLRIILPSEKSETRHRPYEANGSYVDPGSL